MGANTRFRLQITSFPRSDLNFGTPHGFRRALERRNVAGAWAAATELAHVSLPDALELCFLLGDHEPARYPPAAVRWLGRFCLEEQGVLLDETMLVVAHLSRSDGEGAPAATSSLASLFEALGRRELANAVRRWQVEMLGTEGARI